MKASRLLLAAAPALLFAAACQASPPPSETTKAATATSAKAKPAAATRARGDRSPVATTFPRVLVHKSPTCGCCGKWVEHLRASGFEVEVDDNTDMAAIKDGLGVPEATRSCHTAEVGGYFVEGHVPADDIKRLLAEKPKARGISVPNMPAGSPGMEVPSGRVESYTTVLVANDGSTSDFAQHGSADAAAAGEHDHAHDHEH